MFLEYSLDAGCCAEHAAVLSPWAAWQSQGSLFFFTAKLTVELPTLPTFNFNFFLSFRHDVVNLDDKILILRLFSFLKILFMLTDVQSPLVGRRPGLQVIDRCCLILGVCSLLTADLVTSPEVTHCQWWRFHLGRSAPRWLGLDHPQKHRQNSPGFCF